MSEFNKEQQYPIAEAVAIVKERAKEKFDASVEVHFRLGIDPRKGEQQVRGSVALPNGSGKSVHVAVFAEGAEAEEAKKAGADIVGGEELIAEIKSTGKIEFDVAIAPPSMMSKLAQIAKVLGPRGLMPSPKDDTVTQNIGKAVSELKAGKISFKNDETGIVHTTIGKTSFEPEKLVENYKTLFDTIKKMKPQGQKGDYLRSVSISSTMGPGVKVSF